MRETTAAQCPIHPMETQPCPVCLATLDNSMASYNTGYAAGYAAAQAAMPPREPTQTMLTAGWRCMGTTAAAWRAMHDVWAQEQTSGGTQQRPEQANASVPESRTGPLDHQSAAGTNCAAEDGARPSPESTRGPAADPLPVAWATPSLLVTMSAVEKRRLTSPEMRGRGGEWEADARDADRYSVPLYRAAALDRLRAERDELRAMLQGANRDAARLATLVDKYKWQVRDTCTRAERAEAERDALREVVRAADAIWKTVSQTPDRTYAMAAYYTARAKVKP